MNGTIEIINDRKSVRAYEEREIGAAEKAAILNAALQAPSPGNMTLYTVLDITDKSLLETLAVTCDNQPFIATAKMALIFCADYKRWYDVFCRHVDSVRLPGAGDMFLAHADALIAAQTAALAAESLGIGSCYIGDVTERFEIHRELLKLPRYVLPVCMLCFGYPTAQQRKRQKPPRFKAEDMVFENGYDEGKAARMEQMLMEREGLSETELDGWIKRFCARKWNSDFSVEMSRSCGEMIKSWCLPE